MDFRLATLSELQQDIAKIGVTLALIVVTVRHHGDLERMGLIDLIGSDKIFESRQDCLAAYSSLDLVANKPLQES